MLQKLKSFLAEDAYFYSLLLVVVAVTAFGLGKRSVQQNTITNSTQEVSVNSVILTPNRDVGIEADVATVVVASKSGTKYHLPTCPGAKQIKESNIIEFTSIQAAEAAGYTPAANCQF